MTERVRKLLAEAAALPTEERAELIHELARTLPEEYAADEADVDYDELDRRMASVRDGSATLGNACARHGLSHRRAGR